MDRLLTSPTELEWVRFGFTVAGIACVIVVSEALRKVFHLNPEFSRKTVHILVGIGLLSAPWLFERPMPLLLLAIIFAVVNLAAIRMGWLRGMHDTGRRSYGTVYFPVSLIILTALFWARSPELVALAMTAFSLGDAAAAITGESLDAPRVFRLTADVKSVEGSTAMFVTTFVVVSAGLVFYVPGLTQPLWTLLLYAAAVAAVGTAWEAVTSHGFDNLTVPLSHALLLTVLILGSAMTSPDSIILATGLALIVATVSFRWKLLTASGATAAFILGSIIFGLGGWVWTVPIVTFFVLSSLLSQFGLEKKRHLEETFEKSWTRDHGQVAANGGVAVLLIIAQYAFPGTNLYPAYLGSIAAVTADTWGTEAGVLTRGRTWSLVSLRRVPAGSNGGVSFVGTAMGAVGALIISGLGAMFGGGLPLVVAGVAGGVAGSVVDSLVGETLQAKFVCVTCGRTTEKHVHCGAEATLSGGVRYLRNDGVNWVCAVSGAIVALAIAGSLPPHY